MGDGNALYLDQGGGGGYKNIYSFQNSLSCSFKIGTFYHMYLF